jgi:hypothetical protein
MKTVTPDLLSQFESIRKDVSWLAYEWDLVHELFWRYPRRQQLYLHSHDLAMCFLWILGALRDDVINRICRLAEPPRTYGRDNLTLKRILADPALAGDRMLQRRLNTVERHLADVRTHRNKRVAHSDLGTNLGKQPLPKMGKSLPKALKSTLRLTDAIELELTGSCTSRGSYGRQAARKLLAKLRTAAWCEDRAWDEAVKWASGRTSLPRRPSVPRLP